MNICEIKKIYDSINTLPIMKYEEKKNQYLNLIENIKSDERKGVVAVRNRAEKAAGICRRGLRTDP